MTGTAVRSCVVNQITEFAVSTDAPTRKCCKKGTKKYVELQASIQYIMILLNKYCKNVGDTSEKQDRTDSRQS